jgi:hypothetical protein
VREALPKNLITRLPGAQISGEGVVPEALLLPISRARKRSDRTHGLLIYRIVLIGLLSDRSDRTPYLSDRSDRTHGLLIY